MILMVPLRSAVILETKGRSQIPRNACILFNGPAKMHWAATFHLAVIRIRDLYRLVQKKGLFC